jgi:dCTP deaminase
MLNDASLKVLFPTLFPGRQLPSDIDGAQSPIQPASLDMSVGEVYVPDAKTGELGAVGSPQTAPYTLKPGHTAVITTLEALSVPPTHGAIGFPPTTISNNGILMTNPGHVDPGYVGPLTFTVINMGREPFELRRGDRIVTMLFFELTGGRPDKDYAERHPTSGSTRQQPVTQERMNRLAPDMLDVDRRVKEISNSAEAETRRLSIKVPLVLAIVVGAGTIFAPVVSNLVSQNADLQRRISVLEDQKNQDQVQTRLDRLEQQVSRIATPPTSGAPGGTR